MAQLKTWCLLLLLLSIVPTEAEVVRSMKNCTEFLLKETPPHIPGILEGGDILNQNRYKPICQTWKDNRSFVTLYDTENKIPVFSAGKYRGKSNVPRPKDAKWKIEPQLEDMDEDKNMREVDQSKTYNHQAVDNDYRGSNFSRGHLFPSSYGLTKNDKNSTFTLTNIVPQERTFNSGSWGKMESYIKCVMDEYCINDDGDVEAFLVIGAQPNTGNFLKNRVNIPSMLWSAFCCYSSREGKWIASAHWGENVPDRGTCLQPKTLKELQNKLSTSDSVFEVFPGSQCSPSTNLTHIYLKPKAAKTKCKCPPTISTTYATPTTTSAPQSSWFVICKSVVVYCSLGLVSVIVFSVIVRITVQVRIEARNSIESVGWSDLVRRFCRLLCFHSSCLKHQRRRWRIRLSRLTTHHDQNVLATISR